jgi:phage-related protein
MTGAAPQRKRRWRYYTTAQGKRRPAKDFLDQLSVADKAEVLAAMDDVREFGLAEARHLRGDIYEVRAEGQHASFRILFATEGRYSQVLLAISGFSKKTQATPPRLIREAERCLREWREEGARRRAGRQGQ